METEGTLLLSVRKSMYQPGGAIFFSAGTVACSTPGALTTKLRSTSRWVLLKECVVIPGAISCIH